MAVDKHELLLGILNRELLSLLANCVHNLTVKTQALRELPILDYFTVHRNMFPSSGLLVYMLNAFFNHLTQINC